MWRQSDKNNMVLQPLNSHGWTIPDGHLTIEWDSMENIKAIQEQVSLLTKGCKCKTGCTTARCGCKKKGMSCSVGCMCTNCSNVPANEEKQSLRSQQDTAIAEIVQEMAMVDTTQLPETDELVDWVYLGRLNVLMLTMLVYIPVTMKKSNTCTYVILVHDIQMYPIFNN